MRTNPRTDAPARSARWAATMAGTAVGDGVRVAHSAAGPRVGPAAPRSRAAREELEDRHLAAGATRAMGAGQRPIPEMPDEQRTCFERDRDRILHAAAFRRLAGKTQVVVFPDDHQRTRLTHALEVAQVATAVARACGLNTALTEAIALGHDCGHGPGGHASEDALSRYLPDGFDHAVWGAEVALADLNLCDETTDGIRNHSWSRPAPATPEGAVVSWADRIAYVCHDFEDALAAGVVRAEELPKVVAHRCGVTRGRQLHAFVTGMIATITETGIVGLRDDLADALEAFRRHNYERIYLRPASVAQNDAVVAVLDALVAHLVENPAAVPGHRDEVLPHSTEASHAAVRWVAGMTDRYAFDAAIGLAGWDPRRLPRGIDVLTR